MNKTVNINLGGIFFHIDEDAYQRLSRYFDAIKRSLNKSAGQDEIIRDIELRIAELISEKHSNPQQVISIREIDEVIAVMGQPEDYRLDDEETPPPQASFYASKTQRRLYRDRENGVIGGVMAGLGYYLGIDKVWLRIIMVLFCCFYGMGIIAYLVLWIVMPEAITTSEKLEMRREPVTISNIEKKVKEEIDTLQQKFKKADYGKVGDEIHYGAKRLSSSLGDVFLTIFDVLAKIFGTLLIVWGIAVIVSLLIGVFTLGSLDFLPWSDFIQAGNFTDYPIWTFGLLMFLAIGIPFFYITVLGFKLLAPKLKSPGTVVNFSLLGVWVISVGLLVSIGIRQATQYAFDSKTVERETLALQVGDTLKMKFTYNPNFVNSVNDRSDLRIELTPDNRKVIYSNNVSLYIQHTDEKAPFIQIERIAKGSSMGEAKRTASKILYGYKFEKNQLILDNYLLTDFTNKFRDQNVEVYLYLPEGVVFKADETVRNYDNSNDDYFNLHWSSDAYTYKVAKDKILCLDCPLTENDQNDLSEAENIRPVAKPAAGDTVRKQSNTTGHKGLTKELTEPSSKNKP